MTAQRMREFHRHVAEPSKADDANLLVFPDTVPAHWGVRGDPGAQ